MSEYADMAELADALASGASGGNFVQVRLLLSAPPKCQARDKKKFVSGLTIFLSTCPRAQIVTQKSCAPIACSSRNKIAEAGNHPLNLDPVIGMYQHLVNQKIDQLLPQLI